MQTHLPAPIHNTAPLPPRTTPLPKPEGGKVKLGLFSQTDEELAMFAKAHDIAMDGNENFPDPMPSTPEYEAALQDYVEKLAASTAAKTAAKAATAAKDASRARLELALNQRGNYVQMQSNGNRRVIASSAFLLQKARTPVGELPPPLALHLTLNGTPGVMVLDWAAVPHARSYLIEVSPADTMERDWKPLRPCSDTEITLKNLTLGQVYAFRISAVGGSTGQSDWSAEAVRMAG